MNYIQILFDLSSNLSPADILNSTLSRLGGASPEQQKCVELESYLNGMIYGKNGHSDEANRLADVATRYLENKFQDIFNQYDFSQNMMTSQAASEDKIPVEGHQAYHHSKSIQVTTIQERMLAAQNQIKILTESGASANETSKVLEELQALVDTAQSLLNSSENMGIYGSKNPVQVVNFNENTKDLINRLDELWQQLTFYKSMPLNFQDTGYIFERALKTVGTGKSFEEMAEDKLYEIFSSTTKGMELTSRKSDGISAIFEIKPVEKKYKSKTGKKRVSQVITGENGSILELQGEFDEKQGKMDVEMTLPGDDNTFRVSAKNWKSFKTNGFGETSLAAALLRSAGVDEMLAYGLGLGYIQSSNSLSDQLHNYAKMAAIADIVVGLSQQEAYVDTLVINNRSEGHVHVYSVKELLKKVYDQLDNFKLGGYNSGTIQNDLAKMFDWSGHLTSQDYMNRIYSKLAEIQIGVGAGILDYSQS